MFSGPYLRITPASLATLAWLSMSGCGSESPTGTDASGGAATGGAASGGATATSGAAANGGGGATTSGGAAGSGTSGGSSGAGPVDPLDDGLLGWATVHPKGPPSGGFAPIGANPVMSCTASDMKTLRDCLFRAKKSDKANTDTRAGAPDWATWEVHEGVVGGWKKYPLIIYIKGEIDCSQNDAGKSLGQADYDAGDPLCEGATGKDCQQAVIQAKVERGDISIVGIPGDGGEPPTLRGGWLMFRGQENVIVRNLRIVNATDFWPSFESCSSGVTDRDYCAWNAEPDGLTLDNTSRVWIDHAEFTDGTDFDGQNPDKAAYKMYDGLLDIKNDSDFITLSYNRFTNHNKAILVGATDSADGHYGITFHHNLFSFVQQRTPRVRNGEVHVLNNYYTAPKKSDASQEYYFGYALGLGFEAKIYSEANAFDVAGATPDDLLSADFDAWASRFTDSGSWLNDALVDLNAAAERVIDARNAALKSTTPFAGPVEWAPATRYPYTPDTSAEAVRTKVLARAGVGRVTPVPAR